MKNQFKKLFDISYKEKKFTIFVDENHRYTFLEKNKEGKYLYPTIEDFISLNNIYNVHDPFALKSARKYTFNEKVKVGALLLSLSVLTTYSGAKNTIDNKEEARVEKSIAKISENSAIVAKKSYRDCQNSTLELEYSADEEKNWKVSVGEGEVVVNNEPSINPQKIAIKSLNDLDTILNITSVSLKDIDEAIENNDNLDSYCKLLSHYLAVAIYEENPDADLRIFYYNLKTLQSEAMSEEEYKKTFQDYSIGNYNSKENKFTYIIGGNAEVLYHELSHATYSFSIQIDNQIYYRRTTSFSALNEAMNNKIVNLIMPTNSYKNIGSVLDYLLTFTEYDFNRYNEEGPGYILYDIVEQYPNIDVFYINDCLNAMQTSSTYFGETISVEESPELLEELFSLCKEKTNKNTTNIYTPFLEFVKLFPTNEDLFNQYFDEYNQYLETFCPEKVISEEELEEKMSIYNEIRGFAWNRETLYPYIERNDEFITIIEDGIKKQIYNEDFVFYSTVHTNTFFIDFKKALLENPNPKINSEFWKQFGVQYDYINISDVYKTEIMLNGNTLAKDYLSDLKIQIGLTQQNKIGFIIQNQNAEILYQSEENLKYISNSVFLSSYYPVNMNNVSKLELMDILNEEYVQEMQTTSEVFQNLFIEEYGLRLEPYYAMYLNEQNGGSVRIDLNHCMILHTEEDFKRLGENFGLNLEIPFEEPFYLKDILKYYHLLDEKESEYYFTEEEIKELIEKYIEEMNYTQTR